MIIKNPKVGDVIRCTRCQLCVELVREFHDEPQLIMKQANSMVVADRSVISCARCWTPDELAAAVRFTESLQNDVAAN